MKFEKTTWDNTFDTTAEKIKAIQEKYGTDSFAVVSTNQLLTEEFYTLGKLTRGCIGTNNYDGNTTHHGWLQRSVVISAHLVVMALRD